MNSEVVILVSRTHWRCISCRLIHQHVVSIDQHVKTHLGDLLPLAAARDSLPFSEGERSSLSDGELEMVKGFNLLRRKTGIDKASVKEAVGFSTEHCIIGSSLCKEAIAFKENSIGENHFKSRQSKCKEDAASQKSVHSLQEQLRDKFSLQGRKPKGLSRPETKRLPGQSQLKTYRNIDIFKKRMKQQQRHAQNQPRRKRKLSSISFGEKNYSDCEPNHRRSKTVQKQELPLTDVDIHDMDIHKDTRNQKVLLKTIPTKHHSLSPKNHSDPERPGQGGKPVKRTLEVFEQEKKNLSEFYVSIQETQDLGENSSEICASFSADNSIKNDSEPIRKLRMIVSDVNSTFNAYYSTTDKNESNHFVSVESGTKFLTSNENKTEPLSADENISSSISTIEKRTESEPLNSSEDQAELLIPNTEKLDDLDTFENRIKVFMSSECERDSATDKSQACDSLTEMHRLNKTIYHQSKNLFQRQSAGINFAAASHDFLPSNDSCVHYKDYEYPPVTAALHPEIVSNSNIGLSRFSLNEVVSDLSVWTLNNPEDALQTVEDTTGLHSNVHDFLGDRLQAENFQSSVSEPAITKTMAILQKDTPELPESEEWMKNNVKFSFASSRPTLIIPQPDQIFECSVCQAKFSSGKYLSDHTSKMASTFVYQCKICQKTFHKLHNLNMHVFCNHEKRKKPFCFECEEKFQSMASFERHLYKHMQNQDLKLLDMEFHTCHICKGDITCKYATVQKHYYTKHKIRTCLECFVKSELVTLSSAAAFREHQQTHANFCSICIQDVPSGVSLQAHYQHHSNSLQEEDGQGQMCQKCNLWCPNKARVILHHKEHKLQDVRDWRVEKWGLGVSCIHCDKVLRNKRNLQRHIARLHSNSRSYKFHCEFCGKGVDTKSNLKDHIAVRHLGIKRYVCEFCHQHFSCAPSLRRHVLRDHATDKQYSCDLCGEKFCEKFNLTKHMYIHSGLARFMCEHCGKAFHSNSCFKRHTSVHAENREFVCQICGQGYKRREHLKRHVDKCTKTVETGVQRIPE